MDLNKSLYLYLICNFLFMFIFIMLMLLSVAFLTLFERNILGIIQDRKGPNKVGILGIFQPFSDAIKLLSKEIFYLDKINKNIYMISCSLIFLLSVMLWFIIPFKVNFYSMKFGFIYMLVIMSLGVFPLMFMGWSSISSYSMLGAIRSVAQSISYEVSLFLILFSVILLIESYSLNNLFIYQKYLSFFIIIWPIYLMFLVSMLIELNRTPFDLVEGESELVSGFNTEYFSGTFAMIFIAEYLSIIFMSYLITIMFFGLDYFSIKFILVVLFHMIFIIWMRGVLPRIRYDELMYMCWKKFLSLSLIYIMFIFGMKEFLSNF